MILSVVVVLGRCQPPDGAYRARLFAPDALREINWLSASPASHAGFQLQVWGDG